MQVEDNNMILQSISQAIKNGKAQDAINAYILAVSKGISMKLNFKGTLIENKYQNKAQTAQRKDHPIINQTKFIVSVMQKLLNEQQGINNNSVSSQNLIRIQNIVMNLPKPNLNSFNNINSQFVFLSPPKQLNGDDAVSAIKSHFQKISK